jgi:signal transduction histidine kinase
MNREHVEQAGVTDGAAAAGAPVTGAPVPGHGPAARGPRPVRWFRRISVKLALGLGLAMFSIQFFASMVIIDAFSPTTDDLDIGRGLISRPYAEYLSTRLRRDESGSWVPTPEARSVLETFLGPGESYVWLAPDKTVLSVGRDAEDYAAVGDAWPLCDSRVYCAVELSENRKAGSTWTPLGIEGRHIGTFVLIWLEDPLVVARLGRQRVRADALSRLIASGVVAMLTSLLLVSIVTRRLSRLATDASTPLDDKLENVDLPGPFEVSGDDEIARLATALNTMRGRIEELVARLEERDRQRREWVAQVSHDLRTPLTALSACLERAQERINRHGENHNDHAVREAIQVARQDGQRLQTLVDDLFELARLDADESLVLEPVPPGELVRQAVRGLRPLAEARAVALEAVVGSALPTVRADGRRLMRALENMLRNAVHFARARVVLSVSADPERLRFEVSDDGPGLPVRDGEVVLGRTEGGARRPDSAGLGLVVTRRVARAHGGELHGRNRDEGGAVVWISIPIVKAHAD